MSFGSEILGWIKEIEEQEPERRTNCPLCDWPLEEHETKGLHCPMCGWCEGKSIR